MRASIRCAGIPECTTGYTMARSHAPDLMSAPVLIAWLTPSPPSASSRRKPDATMVWAAPGGCKGGVSPARGRTYNPRPRQEIVHAEHDEGAGQARRGQGHLDGAGAGAGNRPERGAGQAREDRDLRHRPAHLQMGRVV